MISGQVLQWREPLWLLLALYPLAMLLIRLAIRRFRHDAYAEQRFMPWVLSHNIKNWRYNRLRQIIYILAWCCFALAMAGPRTADKVYQTDSRNYAEVMIVLDLSQSMSARDILPNRLERARLELLDFLQRAEQTRIGLSVFAARPHLLSPMTHDKSVIRHYLSALKPALLPTAGSNINDALLFASKQFDPNNTASSAILLISDGNSAKSVKHEIQQKTINHLKQNGIQIFSLGIGTPVGQAVVAQLDPRYPQPQTQTTITVLQRTSLQQLAMQTGGRYIDVSDNDSDWSMLYDHGIAKLSAIETKKRNADSKILWRELYHFPVILALVFFILSFVSSARSRSSSGASTNLALVILTVFISATAQPLEAAEVSYASAYRAYQAGEYKQAREIFSQLPGYRARLGEANALYQLNDYASARNTYIQATLAAGNDTQRAEALFNLGNTFYRLKEYIKAQQLYRDVLKYQPQYRAAESNLAHAKLEQRLKDAEQALTYRPGRGPRTGLAAENIDLSNTQVSLGESEASDEMLIPSTATAQIPATNFLGQAELASQQVESNADSGWSYRLNTSVALQVQLQSLTTDNAYVWQRLFEQEEGFPAPLPLPRPIPGVAPW